ncbi:MAG: hypothetical protein Tsb009_07110 [Planctomycetaceae bacterium]
MSWLKRFTFTMVCVAVPVPTLADGLIYSLPKDGSKVIYEMKANKSDKNTNRDFDGTISIASVGSETVDNQKCRWIEVGLTMNFNGQSRKVVSKMLITESDIGKGKIPLANIKRAWIRIRNKTEKLEDVFGRKGGPLPAFLSGPLTDVKKSSTEQIATPAGKFPGHRLAGKTSYVQGNDNREDEFKVEYDLRLSEKVPFGVAAAKITIQEFVQKMRLDDTITLDLKLKSISKNAKSELPDSK